MENKEVFEILDELDEKFDLNDKDELDEKFDFNDIDLSLFEDNTRTNENNLSNSQQMLSVNVNLLPENQSTLQLPTFQETFTTLQTININQNNEPATLQQATAYTEIYSNQNVQNELKFIKQPKKEFQFSYASGPKYIKADDKSSPSITFKTSNLQITEFYLHVDIFEQKQNGSKQFSPYSLIIGKKELKAEPKLREMTEIKKKPVEDFQRVFEFTLEKFYIVQVPDMEKNFKFKNDEFNKKIGKTITSQSYIQQNYAIMLGCQVFYKNGENWIPFTEPVYSREMYPLLNIKVEKKRFKENDKVEVKLEQSTLPENVQVELYCNEISKKISNWSDSFQIKSEDKKKLTFLMPKCEAQILDKNICEINCFLKLNYEFKSFYTKSIKFVYELPKPISRKRPNILVDINENVNTMPISPTSTPKPKIFRDSCQPASVENHQKYNKAFDIELLNKAIKDLKVTLKSETTNPREVFESLNFAFSEKNEHENSIVHAAIEHNKYLDVYQIIKEKQLMELVPTLKNKYGETPLHYACKLQKESYVISLCKQDYSIYLQDNYKQTPLHIAIIESPICLKAFQILMLDEHYTTKELRSTFHWLLQVYDSKGFNILHLAVLKNRFEFLESILKFCQNEKINACDYETLYTDEIILDLAKEPEIYNLILKYYPNVEHHKNYADKKGEEYENKDLINKFEEMALKDN